MADNEPMISFDMAQGKYTRKRSDEQERARCLEYFRRLEFNRVEASLKKAQELTTNPWMSTDSVYRVFHHSFKMYSRFQDAIYLYLTYMLEPVYHHASFVHKTKECDDTAFDQIIYE